MKEVQSHVLQGLTLDYQLIHTFSRLCLSIRVQYFLQSAGNKGQSNKK